MISRWTREHMALYRPGAVGSPPIIVAADAVSLIEGLDLWDLGPVRTRTGESTQIDGSWLWMSLSCPSFGDPAQRHDQATLRLLARASDGEWCDLGPMFPHGSAVGSRQWAGSAVVDGDQIWVTYTASGGAGPGIPHFRQRLYVAQGTIVSSAAGIRVGDWSHHVEMFAPDPDRYDLADDDTGRPGFIKAFRDPYPFVDPTTEAEYVLFAASMPPGQSTTTFNGAIGLATLSPDGWEVLDPLITADGVNNELERPHVIVHDGDYYLFFSTQARTFHPDVSGATGLYGFVSEHLEGPYAPLNDHGVVFTNPPDEPLQAYSWLVLDDLTTHSFVDAHSLSMRADRSLDHELIASDRDHFGGTLAPPLRITLNGPRATLDA